MILTYAKYIDLMSALDEHCEGKLSRDTLQNAIFDRFISKQGSFVAENSIGNKQLFTIKMQRGRHNKRVKRLFRNFMNRTKENINLL